jgi:hypothetical protein
MKQKRTHFRFHSVRQPVLRMKRNVLRTGLSVLILLGATHGSLQAAARSSATEVSEIVRGIHESGKTIYDALGEQETTLWIPNLLLEEILNQELHGLSVEGMPLRTRSKFVKSAICKALGYPTPKAFKKTQPRFPGQNFDVYIQKSNNLQVWNEALSASRRYVLIRVAPDDRVQKVRVVDGATLAKLDTSGKLTQKYQARLTMGSQCLDLASTADTANVRALLGTEVPPKQFVGAPVDPPAPETFIPIAELGQRLSVLLGTSFSDAGSDQERNRGAELHRQMCYVLGYSHYADDGACPDITAQIIEVKLQLSTTIDLGIAAPDSTEPLNLPAIQGKHLRHCDVRYAIFAGNTDGDTVTLTNLILVTGEELFDRFRRFEGRVLNKKLQIYLPNGFFDGDAKSSNGESIELGL